MGRNAKGEGSIFPYRNGYAAYVWVTTPAGRRSRKRVYGKTREIVHGEWVQLHNEARKGPVATSVPSVQTYLDYWPSEVVIEPAYYAVTVATSPQLARYYLAPSLS